MKHIEKNDNNGHSLQNKQTANFLNGTRNDILIPEEHINV